MPTAAFSNVPRNRSSLAQGLLVPLSPGDVPCQGHRKAPATFPERLASDLDRKDHSILASMLRLEDDRLSGVEPAFDVLNIGERNVSVELDRGHPDQLVPSVSQTLACLIIHVQDNSLVVEQEERIRSMVHESPEAPLAGPQRLLGELDAGDVAGDAERADDRAVLVAQWHLGGGNPLYAAIEMDIFFLFADHRLAGADDLLFVLVGRPRVFLREEVEIRLADRLLGVAQAKVSRMGFIDAEKAAGRVLEVDVIRKVIHEGAEQVPLLDQHLLGLFAR